jgi:hypothetical protein
LNLFKRLLAASGVAGLLIGWGATSAFAATSAPFTAQILLACATVGESQTITVQAAADALIHIEVSIGGSTANGGTQNGTGLTDANGTFVDQWTVAAVSTTTTAQVRIYALTPNGISGGVGQFEIHPASGPCPTPGSVSITGAFPEVVQYGGNVEKTCDAGVTGSATFAATIQVKLDGQLLTTVSLPTSLPLTLACNGESEALPKLPPTSVITLHESVLPTGAAAAADTTITIGTEGVTTTIHNAKAAAVATPTPTPSAIVLPATGRATSIPSIPWPVFTLLGLIAIAGAGLVLRRRS